MILVYIELNRLIDDYFKCDNALNKDQILMDIQLLTEALCLSDSLFTDKFMPMINDQGQSKSDNS